MKEGASIPDEALDEAFRRIAAKSDDDRYLENVADTIRLATIRELWKLHCERGNVHMDQTLLQFEAEVKERIERRKA